MSTYKIDLSVFRQKSIRLCTEYSMLEQKYGKYLYVPIDVPHIQANNTGDFLQYYNKHCQLVNGPTASKSTDGRWTNLRIKEGETSYHQLNEAFPELISLMKEHLPYVDNNQLEFFFVSSNCDILSHRDLGEWGFDAPTNLRVLFYDNNPEPNFYLIENRENKDRGDLLPTRIPAQAFAVPRLAETNTFTWNNLRAEHGSVKSENYTKILGYYGFSNQVDWHRYNQLLERSINRFQSQCWLSERTLDWFIGGPSRDRTGD